MAKTGIKDASGNHDYSTEDYNADDDNEIQ